MYLIVQLLGGAVANVVVITGWYGSQWREMPSYVVNDVCDAPGITGTRYGPCPGSPGFRMPTRLTGLPGKGL